jgi:DNA primase
MPHASTDNLIQQLLDRVNLVELISQDVSLKKNGPNFVGLCPFHADSKPSFSVNPLKGLYHCFGCKEGGNALTYMKKARGMSYPEAMEEMARMTGIELPDNWSKNAGNWKEKKAKRDLMFDVNEAASLWFVSLLGSSDAAEAREYLSARGVNREAAAKHGIGFARKYGGLHQELTRSGLSVSSAVEMGLLWQDKDQSSRMGDRFRDRIVFPIRDLSGRVAGFSARALDSSATAKYINSSDAEIFKKGHLLYGLWEARDAIRKQGEIIMVEGQMDVIAMQRAGFENTVAPLGTALTEDQLHLIQRFTNELIILFDGDEAGRRAAEKAVTLCLKTPIRGRVAMLPDGEDPDSLICAGGPDGVGGPMKKGTPFLEWMVRTITSRHQRTMSGKAAAMREAKEVGGNLSDQIERSQFINQIAHNLGISGSSDLVPTMRLPKRMGQRPEQETRNRENAPERAVGPIWNKNAMDIIAILLQYPHLLRRVFELEGPLEELFDPSPLALLRAMLSQWEETGSLSEAILMDELAGEPEAGLLADACFTSPEFQVESVAEAVEKKLSSMKKKNLKERRHVLLQDLRDAELVGDSETLNRAGEALVALNNAIKAL